jgi:hypothetical protein
MSEKTSSWGDTAGESFGLWDGDGEESEICLCAVVKLSFLELRRREFGGDVWRGVTTGMRP